MPTVYDGNAVTYHCSPAPGTEGCALEYDLNQQLYL